MGAAVTRIDVLLFRTHAYGVQRAVLIMRDAAERVRLAAHLWDPTVWRLEVIISEARG